ncbi:hypothetical protein HELRODRAFT_189231 [Helobdella robusta]|uniref:Uncharacterized protein n=1 Tax=Helobdella robusta TaxID=6412 RepID=T1FQU3_HELRO|nr:hypothetical protein HELRODRAFT_189231 [Helobdella robusta]ESN96425.1 hypothetical protein HELRODRAFT_189231 [Helobdella robusta]
MPPNGSHKTTKESSLRNLSKNISAENKNVATNNNGISSNKTNTKYNCKVRNREWSSISVGDLYRPVKPASSKFLQKRWDETMLDTHHKRILGVKHVVDTRPPRIHLHLILSLKKLQMKEDDNRKVEYENMNMLKKIIDIQANGGFVDNHNKYCFKKSRTMSEEMSAMMRRDQLILQRMVNQTPHYLFQCNTPSPENLLTLKTRRPFQSWTMLK